MSRYRKIEVRIWADDKFRALSPLPPSGQSLWLFLLTGPHTGPIPGLFRAGPMAMAEELGWQPEDFRKAFQEVFNQGMAKADWKARVVWIPKAIKHNMPQSPNVIKSWEEDLKLIPECPLKTEALQGVRAALEPLGEAYLSVFDSITQQAKPFSKPFAKPMPNQEQEQEQEQEKKDTSTDVDVRPLAAASGPAEPPRLRSVKPPCPYDAIRELYHEILPELRQCRVMTDTRKGYIRQRWHDWPGPDLHRWRKYFGYVRDSDFLMGKKGGHDGRPPFECDLEWLTKPSNCAKVREGKYHHHEAAAHG